MNLTNPEEEVKISPELQKKTDVARSNLTLMEQDFIRVKTLAKDQEAVVRGMLDKQGQITADIAMLESTQSTLLAEVTRLSSEKSELADDLGSLNRVIISKQEEKKALLESCAALVVEAEAAKKEIAESRAKHEQYLRDSDAVNEVKKNEATDILTDMQTKKGKLLKVLAEL
jgi:hypothetical protein